MGNSRLHAQLRISAFAGCRSAIKVIIFTLLMLPVNAAINAIFDRTAKVDWSLSLKVSGTIAVIWFCVTFLSTYLDLGKQIQIEGAINPSFPATSFMSGLYGLTAIFSLVLILGLRREGTSLGMQILTLVFPAISFYAWPRTIHCDDSSIWQWNRWGWRISIPYNEIQSISTDYSDGTITVLGSNAVIQHTPYHVDHDSFRHVISKRSGKPIY